jgi:hypothetical protein
MLWPWIRDATAHGMDYCDLRQEHGRATQWGVCLPGYVDTSMTRARRLADVSRLPATNHVVDARALAMIAVRTLPAPDPEVPAQPHVRRSGDKCPATTYNTRTALSHSETPGIQTINNHNRPVLRSFSKKRATRSRMNMCRS